MDKRIRFLETGEICDFIMIFATQTGGNYDHTHAYRNRCQRHAALPGQGALRKMNRRQFGSGLLSAVAYSLATPALAKSYVDHLRVVKSERLLELMSGGRVLRSYNVTLGPKPEGHKRFVGDGRTPEGVYRINRRNPQSSYYLSLGIDYPNDKDRAYARSQGRSPGGDIFIHGLPNGVKLNGGTVRDGWTRGCIALTNEEMDEIWRYVPIGCPIDIKA